MKTEQQTRIELIDAALGKAGWNVKNPQQVVQEYDILVDPFKVSEACTPYGGHQFSDYVLLGRDRKPLAVVEAKKTSKDAALGREQAKQYCYNICKDKGVELPFCFYTNGLEIYFWDLENYPPRKIVGFPTLDDLERFRYIRQRKKSLTDELINTNRLSPHFFDLVVIDESHRSIYSTYGEILDYFKAINLGLTATPTDVIDHNTFELFACEDGLPTFAYTYEEAATNTPPYLCDFQVMKIQTKFQKEGISKRTISLEDQKRLILEGKDIEEINFEGSQLEKQVINKGTNTLIVKEFMEECIKDLNGVLSGKTIQTKGIASINSTQLKNFPLIIPPIDLQKKYAVIAEKVETLKSRYQQSLSELENLYGALSQKAFKGELDLSRILLDKGPEATLSDTTTEPADQCDKLGRHAMSEATEPERLLRQSFL